MITITVTQNRDTRGRFIRMFDQQVYAAMSSVIPMIEQEMVTCLGTQYYSLLQLKAMGHPYSRSHPNPPTPPGVINRQTGEFFAGLSVRAPKASGSLIMLQIVSRSWKSDLLLHGTARMIDRPYDRELKKRLDSVVPNIIKRALINIRTWR